MPARTVDGRITDMAEHVEQQQTLSALKGTSVSLFGVAPDESVDLNDIPLETRRRDTALTE